MKFNFKIFSLFNVRMIVLWIYNFTGKSVRLDIQTTRTTGNVCCGLSLLTEPPSVKGNLTEPKPRVQLPYHSVWEKKVFWTWLDEMFISSNIRGDISLLIVNCGAAMIEVCLWLKNSAIRWVFGPQTAFEWTRSGPPAVLCMLYLLRIMKRVTGVKQ